MHTRAVYIQLKEDMYIHTFRGEKGTSFLFWIDAFQPFLLVLFFFIDFFSVLNPLCVLGPSLFVRSVLRSVPEPL